MEDNSREAILTATKELLQSLVQANGVRMEDTAFILFTTTPDLTAEFPAVAARELGWTETALLCSHEMNVPHGLPRCLRILLLLNTEKKVEELEHVYLKEARNLRARGGEKG